MAEDTRPFSRKPLTTIQEQRLRFVRKTFTDFPARERGYPDATTPPPQTLQFIPPLLVQPERSDSPLGSPLGPVYRPCRCGLCGEVEVWTNEEGRWVMPHDG